LTGAGSDQATHLGPVAYIAGYGKNNNAGFTQVFARTGFAPPSRVGYVIYAYVVFAMPACCFHSALCSNCFSSLAGRNSPRDA
jgi:hypothetical protein